MIRTTPKALISPPSDVPLGMSIIFPDKKANIKNPVITPKTDET